MKNMKSWKLPEPVSVPEDMAQYLSGHPLLAKLLVRRGIETVPEARQFLDPEQYIPSPPEDLPTSMVVFSFTPSILRRAKCVERRMWP